MFYQVVQPNLVPPPNSPDPSPKIISLADLSDLHQYDPSDILSKTPARTKSTRKMIHMSNEIKTVDRQDNNPTPAQAWTALQPENCDKIYNEIVFTFLSAADRDEFVTGMRLLCGLTGQEQEFTRRSSKPTKKFPTFCNDSDSEGSPIISRRHLQAKNPDKPWAFHCVGNMLCYTLK